MSGKSRGFSANGTFPSIKKSPTAMPKLSTATNTVDNASLPSAPSPKKHAPPSSSSPMKKAPTPTSASTDPVKSPHKRNNPKPSPPPRTRAIKGRKRWWFFALLTLLVCASLYWRRDAVPAGYVVDDDRRPGLLYAEPITVRRPVIFIPGFISTALEVWDNHPCAGTLGNVGTLFRERMFGPQMLLHLLNDPECYAKHYALSKESFGDDPAFPRPETAHKHHPAKIRVRPAGWLDAANYLVTGFWIWAKIMRSFADIGYDPNTMILMPYDWRLSPQLMQRRDGYFHRLRGAVEEAVRVSGGVKAVIISHSFGAVIQSDFLQWVEAERPGWTDAHLHALAMMGAPMLGVMKSVSALLSGEMRDTAMLPSVARIAFNAHLRREVRVGVTRSWPCQVSMFPRGGDLLWPDVVSLFNQTVHLRGSDVIAALAQVAADSGHSGLVSALGELRTTYDTLPHLPRAPNLKVFAFYGVDIPAETGYAYTLAQDELESDVQLSTADARELLRAGVSPRAVGAHMTHAGDAFAVDDIPMSMAHRAHSGDATKFSDASRGTDAGAFPRTPDEWRGLVDRVVRVFQSADLLNDSKRPASAPLADESGAADGGGEKKSGNDYPATIVERARHTYCRQDSSLPDACFGCRWCSGFLGNITSGTALNIDYAIDDHDVRTPHAHSPHRFFPASTASTKVVDEDESAPIAEVPERYRSGVRLGPGDATVPLLSLGYMARAPDGWAMDVGAENIIVKEFLHNHDEEAHGQRVAAMEKKNTAASAKVGSGETKKANGEVDATQSKDDGAGSTTTHPGCALLETAGVPCETPVAALSALRSKFLSAIDMRGGTASADHVDIIGNYELITDLLHIATGNDHRVRPRILSDIDTRIAEITRRRKGKA